MTVRPQDGRVDTASATVPSAPAPSAPAPSAPAPPEVSGTIYYGWYVVGACNCVAFITWGVGIFNQGVFLGYFVEHYGWSRATLSLGSTLFHLCAGVAGVIVGRAIDRHGPRAILLTGAAAMATGAVAFGISTEIAHVFAAFFALSIGFACLHTVTIGKIVARWFLRERGRAMALATFGAGIGGALLVPFNAFMLERWGGPTAGVALAVVTLLMIVPLAIWVVKDGPESLGLRADGAPAPAAPTQSLSACITDGAPATADQQQWSLQSALRTAAFWAITFSFSAAMLAQSGMLLHQVMFLQNTFGLVGAASVVTATTVAGMVGRASFALAGNRLASRDAATAAFVLQASGYILFAVHPVPWSLVVGSCVFGFTMGIIVTLQPLTVAQCFGERAFGRIFGPVYMAIRIGSAAGPLIIGVMVAALGDYADAWLVLAGALGLAAVAIRWATPPAIAPRADQT